MAEFEGLLAHADYYPNFFLKLKTSVLLLIMLVTNPDCSNLVKQTLINCYGNHLIRYIVV